MKDKDDLKKQILRAVEQEIDSGNFDAAKGMYVKKPDGGLYGKDNFIKSDPVPGHYEKADK